MTGLQRVDRPVPHLDEPELVRSWDAGALVVGRDYEVGERRYRILGCDPFGVRPRCVYLLDLETGAKHTLVGSPSP